MARMSKAEDKSRKLAGTLKAVLAAAPIIRAWSYNSVREAEFDAAKRDRLKTIGRRARTDIAEGNLNHLLMRTSIAVENRLALNQLALKDSRVKKSPKRN
jgi:hypothetical protein